MEIKTEQEQEIWHVDSSGEIVETNFAEITSWIEQGSLQRGDKVRKGNLRWIEAGKVPALISVFNAKEHGQPIAPVITTTKLEPAQLDLAHFGRTHRPFANEIPEGEPAVENVCSVHPEAPAAFNCETCVNLFCRSCPSSYGGTVKICPFCGALCKPVDESNAAAENEQRIQAAIREGFGFGDFVKAIVHPFRFPASLILGGVMYTIFAVGQTAASLGGIFLLASAIICFMLANMLTFGVLANTVENFTQGKLDANFMPSFDDFSLWDDIVHPLFLSIGVYISSFGPFLLVVIIAVFMLMGSAQDELSKLPASSSQIVSNSELPFSVRAAKQSQEVRELVNRQAQSQQARVDAIERNVAGIEENPPRATAGDPDEEYYAEMNGLIAEHRKAQLESAIGKSPETVTNERNAFVQRMLGYGVLFIIFGGVTLLWGLFYFPAACAVAGYTRSFMATLNPMVGLDTIKRLGGSYALILVMGLLLLIASGIVSWLLGMIFAPFDLPAIGNIVAGVFTSFFGFYLSVVFSCIIGYALFKASDRLELYR